MEFERCIASCGAAADGERSVDFERCKSFSARTGRALVAKRAYPHVGQAATLSTCCLLLIAAASSFTSAQTDFGSSPDGQPVTGNVAMTFSSAGTIGAIQVLTKGVPNADFVAAPSGSTCLEGTAYSAGQRCVVAVRFAPTFPGPRSGAVVLLDTVGNVLATSYLSGAGLGALGVLVPGEMTTFAGDGEWVSVNDGGLATLAGLYLPSGVAIDGGGNLYIADSAHNRIREVYAANGTIATIAGDGDPGYKGDNGSAVHASLNGPRSVALDGAGNIYIADTGNNVIRKIWAGRGIITTVAGNGNQGYSGDGGPAASASLSAPAGITVDNDGHLYIADTADHRIREVDPASGMISTIAGNGATTAVGNGSYSGDGGLATLAGLNFPYSVAIDVQGNLYIPDSGNQRVREVFASTGKIVTVAGNGRQGFSGENGPALAASLDSPSGVAFDVAGNLFVADTQNNRIRKVKADSGTIVTIAGDGTGKYGGDAGNAVLAGLFGPYGVLVDDFGNLFIADYFDHRIRKVASDTASLTFKTTISVGQTSAPQDQVVENQGNAALDFTALSLGVNTAVDPASTLCSLTTPLAAGAGCNIGVEFAPTEGISVTGNVEVTGPFVNSPLNIGVSGTATGLVPTTVLLTSGQNPAMYGQSVPLVAAVSTGTGVPAGTVTFTDAATPLAPPITLNSSATATYTFAASVGLHSIVAIYNGDAQHLPSASSTLAQVVNESTTTTLLSNQNPSVSGASIQFTAHVTSPDGGVAPSGPLIFNDGPTVLDSTVLDPQGEATFATSNLAPGPHSITAGYSGLSSAYILGSASTALNEQIQEASSTELSSTPNPSIYGSPALFTATVTSPGRLPLTGAVNFFDQTAQIGSAFLAATNGSATVSTASFASSTLATGVHSISAVYAGSQNAVGSTSPAVVQTVEPAPTSTTASASPNSSLAGSTVVLAAEVRGADPTGNGNVVFLVDGTLLGSSSVTATGAASFSTSTLAVGAHSLVANYLGGKNNSPSVSNSVPFTVLPIPTTTNLTAAPGQGATTQTVLTATVAGVSGPVPTGMVAFSSGSTALGAAALNGAGIATLTANLNSGASSVIATYPGDSLHNSSTSAPVSVSILAAGFQIQLDPASVTMTSSQNANVALTVVSAPGFADQIGFGCASLPPLVTCHFSAASVTLAANAQQTASLTIDTNSPLSGGTVAEERTSSAPINSFAIAGLMPAAGILFLIRRRMRQCATPRKVLTLLACAAVISQFASCGAITQRSAAPGTYVIQVVGTGVNTGLTQAIDLTVTVTQ